MSEREKTIAYCHACGAAMDVSAVAPFSNVACPKCDKHTRVKREFGPYTLVRRHAVGGMSMVFAAHDNTLDREVALKILSEEYSADERRIDAFVEEARLTASFSHPHVVRVLTTGRAFGRFYIAMEFVPGGHFEHQIRERGRVPEKDMLPLAIEVAQGLKAAHAAGLIHRDVKPGNILLDAEGHAKLVDFGLALVTQGGKAKATELWATPYYVPPETVEGGQEDFRSDIYAFGATVYHALAGQPPCDEETMATDKLREAKRKVRPLGQVAPTISDETCQLVDMAMAYDPENRFGSYDELIRRLESSLQRVKSGKSESTVIASRRRADKKRRKRNILIGQVMTGVVLVVGLVFFLSTRGGPEEKPAVEAGPIVSEPVAVKPVAAVDTGQIMMAYREARAAVQARDFGMARQTFLQLHGNADVQEPTRTWAGVEAVMAAYLDGRSGEGRKLASSVLDHARSLAGGTTRVGDEVVSTLGKLGGFEPVPVSGQRGGGLTPENVASAMLAGLKNWQQGFLDQAAAGFRVVASAELAADEDWGIVYQGLAREFLEDYEALSGPLFGEAPQSAAACKEAADALNAVRAGLKTQGRAPFNVRAWQLDLKRRAKLLRERAASGGGGSLPVAPEAPALDEVMEKVRITAEAYDFTAMAAYLKSLPGDPEGGSRESLIAVAEAAGAFLKDMEGDLVREAVVEELSLKSGVSVVRLSFDPGSGNLAGTTPAGGMLPCGWRDLSAESMITLHRVLVRRLDDEQAASRRHERAIAFGWLAGDRERVLEAAEKLSSSDELFKERWEKIAPGLPR